MCLGRIEGHLILDKTGEHELVKGCLAADRNCQELLYGRFARRMYAVCLRYARHNEEAQDLLQEGFIRVFEKLDSFRLEGSLEGWVRRIMVHTAINHFRRKASQQERIGMDHIPEVPVSSNAIGTLGEQELLALVSDLPDGYRHVFNLYAIEGYDHAEIASMMGCGESTSRSQLAKARKMLQLRLHEKERTVHARHTSY